MKKAKKIVIGAVGAVAAIGVAIAWKMISNDDGERGAQLEYGVFYDKDQKMYLNPSLTIDYGMVSGSELRDIIQRIDLYNETASEQVKYHGPLGDEIEDNATYEVLPEYGSNDTIERVMANLFVEMIEENIAEE